MHREFTSNDGEVTDNERSQEGEGSEEDEIINEDQACGNKGDEWNNESDCSTNDTAMSS
jgi:hypothetical protein